MYCAYFMCTSSVSFKYILTESISIAQLNVPSIEHEFNHEFR